MRTVLDGVCIDMNTMGANPLLPLRTPIWMMNGTVEERVACLS